MKRSVLALKLLTLPTLILFGLHPLLLAQPSAPPRGRSMPAMPTPGPCPLPTLAALPALDDTSFYQERDVPHGRVEVVQYPVSGGGEKRMHIYLPAGYSENESVRYPVLYLNHGGGDDDSKWSDTGREGGHAQQILDNLIADGHARPMIIVMPNTRGVVQASPPPMDTDDQCTKEFLQDIIPFVDTHYRTQPNREHRALAGLSMGGFVVMHTGLSHLDTFSELYVYSSGHFPEGRPQFEERFKSLFTAPETNQRFRVPIYFASGETDIALRNGQGDLAILNRYGIRNFWVLSTGGHEWANWRRYLWQTAQIMFPDCEGK